MEAKDNTSSLIDFIEDWKTEFTDKIEQAVKSRKEVFTLDDAIKKSITKNRRSKFDSVMIEYLQYVNKNPLRENDYFKYLNSYKQGRKLDKKYFKHDLSLLYELYNKIDQNPEYSPFSVTVWRSYVLFMLLKFNNVYNPETMDELFRVENKGSREYNPMTKLTRPLRGMLPKSLNLVQYDISRAYPTFIDMELNIKRKEDIYSLVDKKTFNTILNLHSEAKNKPKIEDVRAKLRPAYGNRVNEVITEKRFNTKGQMFEDLSVYEKKYIERFIEANNIKTFVRLHDAIFIDAETEIKQTEFEQVKFKKSVLQPPEIVNNYKLFYDFDDKGNIITSPVSYKNFFEQENFIRVSIKDDDNITIFKDTNNVVNPFNHRTNTVSFLKSKINEIDPSEVENKIAKDNNKDIRDSFCLLNPEPLVYYRDPYNAFGIPFKNGFIKLKKDDIENVEVIPYKNVKGFFPEHSTQKRNFTFKKESKISEFERFLTMVSVSKDPLKESLTKEEKITQFQFFRMFGYLLHTYKNPTFCPSIILSDHDADDNNRNGGRGKTAIANAVGLVQKLLIKGGNEFDGGYRHRFADLDESYKVYVIDDVPASFNYNDLYTNIIGGITVEPKGKKSRYIDSPYTPKFLITTNWAVRYDKKATSTNRRFIEFKLTDYFNINHTPKDVFKHILFDDWNTQQWNDFYNFCFACVGSYLEYGLEAPRYDKESDNYKVYFYNDVVLNEFERIFKEITREPQNGFNVSEFLRVYKSSGNALKSDKLFTHLNLKTYINTYLKFHKIPFNYREDLKKWFIETSF